MCLRTSSADPGPPRTQEGASWAQVPTLDTQHSFGGLSPLAFCRDSSGPTLRGSIGGVRMPVSYVTISLGTSGLHSAVQTNFRDSKASMGFRPPPKTSHRPAGPKKRDGVQEHPSPQAPGGASHSHLSHPRGDNWIRDCGLLQIVLAPHTQWGHGQSLGQKHSWDWQRDRSQEWGLGFPRFIACGSQPQRVAVHRVLCWRMWKPSLVQGWGDTGG